MTTKPKITKGQCWRRKREPWLRVIVDRVGKNTMDFVVQWNLTIYMTTEASFRRNYRPETPEEASRHAKSCPG